MVGAGPGIAGPDAMIPPLPSPYVEHLLRPRGLGDVTLAQAAGEVGSMVGGGGVRVTLAWREVGRKAVLDEVMVRVFGSHALLAPASALVTATQGMDDEEAARLAPGHLVALLRGAQPGAPPLPAAVERGCRLVVEAFLRALGVESAGRPADPLGVGVLVCRCLGVGDRQVRQAVREGARTPEQVGERCRAGTGCRSCRPDLWTLIDEVAPLADAGEGPDAHPVARIVWLHGGRALGCLGMRLTAVRVLADAVEIAVEPARARPDTQELGAVAIVRHLLRETVDPALPVRLLARA